MNVRTRGAATVLALIYVGSMGASGCLGEDPRHGDPTDPADASTTPDADGGGGTSDGGATVDAASPSLTASDLRPRVRRGGGETLVTLTLDRRGITGDVPVSVTGLPAGVSSVAPPIPASGTTSVLGLSAAPDAGVGFFPFQISASTAPPISATAVVAGDPGSYDTTFDNDGVLVDATTAVFHTALVLPDGSIVAAGASALAGGTWVLRRFAATGVADAAFGAASAGKLPTTGSPRALALDPTTNKLLVVGSSQATERLTLVRLNADGSLDETFGNAGTVLPSTVDHPQGSRGNAVVVTADSRVIVAGRKGTEGYVARYLADGKLDGQFAELTTAGEAELFGVALLPSSSGLSGGRLLAGGTTSAVSPPAQLAVRLSVDGSPDVAFGTGGERTYASGCRGFGFAVAANGDAVLVGGDVTAPSLCTTRFSASGTGQLLWTKKTSAGSSGQLFSAAAAFSEGATYAGGEAGGSQDRYALLERRQENGDLDPKFANQGTLRIEDEAVPDTYRYVIRGVVPAPDGRLLLVGNRTLSSVGAFVMRVWQ